MLIHLNGEAHFLDYREHAPAGASRDMYLDEQGEVIEKASLSGSLAAGVPGTVEGFWQAHQRFGTLPWADLVQPAVALARDGFVAPAALADNIQAMRDWHGDRTNLMAKFGHMRAGEMFRQPNLAATLTRIAQSGPEDFYRGQTARLIVAQMQRSGGLISAADLAQYNAVWREPLRTQWRGLDVLTAPPPSSGGFALIQLLKMKDYLADEFDGLAHNSPQYIHLIAEMEKRVFADRAEYFGDPAFTDVPIDALIDEGYIAQRASEVNPAAISPGRDVHPGLESPDTTHFSIVDQWGNAVSNTYTINWEFGSGVVVDGAGFILNNEMDDFSAKPGAPNVFGVVGSTANEIHPGKRPLSSMTPTIVLRDGQADLVLGTRGGSTIFTSVFQAMVNLYDFGMSPQQAVDATRFHHQLLPPKQITYSPGRPLSAKTIAALEHMGYEAIPHGWEFGDLQLIQRDAGALRAASDARGRGQSTVIMSTKR